MPRRLAQAVVVMLDEMDGLTDDERGQAMALLVQRYGLPAVYESAQALEDRRRTDRERAERYRASRDAEGENHVTSTTPSTLLVVKTEEKSVKKQKYELLTEEQEARAKTLLGAGDYDFLCGCPEPFRAAWLGHPEWWISMRDSFPKLAIQRETSKCMGWIQGRFTPAQQQQQNLRDRLRRWLAKADSWRESAEMRKAVRQ